MQRMKNSNNKSNLYLKQLNIKKKKIKSQRKPNRIPIILMIKNNNN